MELVAEFNDLDGTIPAMIAVEEALFTDIDEAVFPDGASHHALRTLSRRSCWTAAESRYQSNSTSGTMTRATSWVSFVLVRDGNGLRALNQRNAQRGPGIKVLEVELLSETTNIVPGIFGWRSGFDPPSTGTPIGTDSGEPTTLTEGRLQRGLKLASYRPASALAAVLATDLVNFGCEQEVVLPVAVTLPGKISAQTRWN